LFKEHIICLVLGETVCDHGVDVHFETANVVEIWHADEVDGVAVGNRKDRNSGDISVVFVLFSEN
jgi:hypothetical protein